MSAVKEAVQELKPVIAAEVAGALRNAAVVSAPAVQKKIDEATKQVAAVVVNQTNQEPWYQSNVTMGILLAGLATIVKPWAPELAPFLQDPDTAAAVVTAIQGIGLLWAFAGRWWIKKPIGQ